MNISCLICTDIFTPSSDVYTTQCGHIFHHHCLLHWLENSKTCPQCRSKITEQSLVRLYINQNSQVVEGDFTVLQHRLDGAEFQLRLKDKEIKNFVEKCRSVEEKNKSLRLKVKELEMSELKHESVMAALKDQIKFFKQKSLACDKLLEEVNQLKSEIKSLENVQATVNGSRQQVEEIIRNENSVESLALLAATLKKSLIDTDRRKRELYVDLKKAQNDLSLQKRNFAKVNTEYEYTKCQLESFKSNYQKEITYLKNKFSKLQSKAVLNDSVNSSINRITLESPVNFNKTPGIKKNETNAKVKEANMIDMTGSPNTSQSLPDTPKDKFGIEDILESPSPLPASSMGVLAIHRAKTMLNTTDQNKFSIFKNKSVPSQFEPFSLSATSSRKNDVTYDGFGGSSKDDIFPSPQKISVGSKRPKTLKTTSAKFKKLSAEAGKTNRTMADFFS